MICISRLALFLGTIFIFVNVSLGLQQQYRQDVAVNLIMRNVTVSSISFCYNDCWRNTDGCCAVGFLLNELNNKNVKTVTCFMIQCGNDQNGEMEEMEVFTVPATVHKINSGKLAKDGNVTQSSILNDRVAALAVDGNYEQASAPMCASTENGHSSDWWEFTFNFNVWIEHVEIYVRSDCCMSRMYNAVVEVYDANRSEYLLCGLVVKQNTTVMRVNCATKWLRGRGVRITQSALKETLGFYLCEVDFYGAKTHDSI